MAITAPVYATREDVKGALDLKETARNNREVDRAIMSASRTIEGLCHRRFYPQTATRFFPWPNGSLPWRLWLEDSELISVTTLSSGGTVIPPANFFLEPNVSGPPFNQIQVSLSSSSAFGGGPTTQRDITVTGLFGYSNDETPVGDVDEAMTTTETDMDVTDSSGIGVGQILRVGSERLIVTEKAMKDTGVNIDASDSLTAAKNDVSITLSTLTGAPTPGEVILINSERMLVVDVAGTVATVIRGWDGSVLAAHAANADIFAPRTLTVARGALGTMAAAMSAGDDVFRWDPPAGVQELCVAEAVVSLLRGSSGYAAQTGVGSTARTVGGGSQASRIVPGALIDDIREQVYTKYGRKARHRAV